MDEAERLCDRVAIVDHGKVIALGSPRELIASLGGEHVIEFSLERQRHAVKRSMLERRSAGGPLGRGKTAIILRLSVAEPHVALPALLERTLQNQGCELASLTTRHASLEDVFVTLTGRHLRTRRRRAVSERLRRQPRYSPLAQLILPGCASSTASRRRCSGSTAFRF